LLPAVVNDVEVNLDAFNQAAEARLLNSLDMYKYVAAAIIRGNEAKTSRLVEPLHGPARHVRSPNFETRTDRKVNSAAGRGANLKVAAPFGPVRLNCGCDCGDRLARYDHLMTARIAYDVYRGTADRSLRLATMPGAGLPAHVKPRDWVLMPAGKSPVHSDAEQDIGMQGYCFFQVVNG
jgi:hypothetical protein